MEPGSGPKLDICGLVLVPAVLTLAITLLRLGGELLHWSPRLFNPAAGGGFAIVGISWLPFVLGPYFAIKLARAGHGACSPWKAFALSVLGLLIVIGGGFLGFAPRLQFPGKQVVGYIVMVLGAAVIAWGWPALFKVLVAYGYAARVPVVIIMFLALRGHWGTHYDALPAHYVGPASFAGLYLQVAFLPQMVSWIVFTVLVGALFGTFLSALVVGGRAPVPAA